MRDATLHRAALVTAGLWLAAQVVLVWLYYGQEASIDVDCAEYQRQALEALAAGRPYPTSLHVREVWIQSVGMVNYLALQHLLFGTFHLNQVINVLLNVGILLLTARLAKRFFGTRTACVSIIFYCLVASNAFLPIHGLTELPFLFLCLSGFTLTLETSRRSTVLAGACLALAFTFRPMALAFLLPALLFLWLKKRRRDIVFLLLPCVLLWSALALYTKRETGTAVVAATTGGFNLLMTANDRADGLSQLHFYYDEPTYAGYIPDMERLSFREKDSIWTARALDWIASHPARYAALFAKKIPLMYLDESWAFPYFHRAYKALEPLRDTQPEAFAAGWQQLRLLRLLHSAFYFLLLPLFLLSLYRHRRELWHPRSLTLLILLLGTAATCLFPVEPRYHQPYLFVIVIWAAATFCPISSAE